MTASMMLVRRSVYGFEKQRTPSITRLTRQRENCGVTKERGIIGRGWGGGGGEEGVREREAYRRQKE